MKIQYDKVYKIICYVHYFIKSFRKFDKHFSDIFWKFFNFMKPFGIFYKNCLDTMKILKI